MKKVNKGFRAWFKALKQEPLTWKEVYTAGWCGGRKSAGEDMEYMRNSLGSHGWFTWTYSYIEYLLGRSYTFYNSRQDAIKKEFIADIKEHGDDGC